MRIKCDYCGNFMDDQEMKCPYCGAANNGIKRSANGVPKTIEELKKWYIDHHLPDENTTRFFIGRDYSGPRAFGIYKDQSSGKFIVYKNKSDGTRVTRYSGTDEAYAVNELYMKLKEEMQNQRNNFNSYRNSASASRSSYGYGNRNINTSSRNTSNPGLIIAIIIIIFIIMVASSITNTGRHYYSNGGYSYSSNYSNNGYSSSSSYYDNDYSSSSWDSDWDSSWDSDWDSDWSDWDSDW